MAYALRVCMYLYVSSSSSSSSFLILVSFGYRQWSLPSSHPRYCFLLFSWSTALVADPFLYEERRRSQEHAIRMSTPPSGATTRHRRQSDPIGPQAGDADNRALVEKKRAGDVSYLAPATTPAIPYAVLCD
nr:hypothetical protein [Pandoravirus aubagnensis]